jgi:hypothetical protein
MSLQRTNPAQQAAGRARKCIAVEANVSESNAKPFDIQRFRADWIARRVPSSRQNARVIAVVYFEEAAQ